MEMQPVAMWREADDSTFRRAEIRRVETGDRRPEVVRRVPASVADRHRAARSETRYRLCEPSIGFRRN